MIYDVCIVHEKIHFLEIFSKLLNKNYHNTIDGILYKKKYS